MSPSTENESLLISTIIEAPINATSTLQTFDPFSRLPIELRLKIWRNAVPIFPRVIEFSKPSVASHNNGMPTFEFTIYIE
jgi:hypothetical protein